MLRYSIMNHAWIEKAMSEAVQHSKICPGKLSVGKESTPKHVSGSFYSSYELVCSEGCGKKMHVETDVFNEKPDPDLNCNDTTANDSAITKVFEVAIRNIGFVFAEVETLFNLMGSKISVQEKTKIV